MPARAFPLTEHPLFLDLGPNRPSTRSVADMVRRGGTAALTTAETRADAARYQEVTCRSALNRVEGMPFSWTLNPYRGCTHGCHYCFARRYHTQFEMNADDDFASVILVKHNIVPILRRELDRPSWHRELVAVGTATDPYQPIEGLYKLTRGCLEQFAVGRTPVAIVTKGPMVVRDRDVLQTLSRSASCTIHMSVPTVDEDAWRTLEPGTAHPLQRLRAVRELVDAGLNAGVLMAPIVPGFSSSRSKLERTVRAIADHGARFVGCNVMYLQGEVRRHFMQFLSQSFPSMRPRYERLYVKKHAPVEYRREVKGMVSVLQDRYGLALRNGSGDRDPQGEQERPDGERSAAEQVRFAW